MVMNSHFVIFSLTVMEDMVQVAQIPLKDHLDKLAVVMFIWGRLWVFHQYPLLCLTWKIQSGRISVVTRNSSTDM